MGIFIKSGILRTLKFHLHTLSCHFWLNLWIGDKSVRFIYCCKKDDIISFVSTKQIECDSVTGVMLKNVFLDETVYVLGSKMLLNLVQFWKLNVIFKKYI